MSEYVYAVMNANATVTNVVIADNDDAVSMLRLLIPEAADIVLTSEESGQAFIGGDMFDGRFRPPAPLASWVWNGTLRSWEAPVPYPAGDNGFVWSEEAQEWVPIPAATPDDTPPGE